jgi:hypothetical protein
MTDALVRVSRPAFKPHFYYINNKYISFFLIIPIILMYAHHAPVIAVIDAVKIGSLANGCQTGTVCASLDRKYSK